jgi:hypothetical protein
MLEREMALRVQRDLFVADQRDGGVGGGGTGSRRGGSFYPLGMRTGDHQKESENKQGMKEHIFSHNHNLTTSGIISRVYLLQMYVVINKICKKLKINNLPIFLRSYIS